MTEINRIKTPPIVIKVSGHRIAEAAFLQAFADAVCAMTQPVVIVHGGGKEISTLQEQLGLTPHYIDGVRVTDEASLAAVTMVLRGAVNTRLVRYLVSAGVDAQGISGVDRGMIRAAKMPHPEQDMGFTGDVTSVRAEMLQQMLASGVTPVIAPMCMGEDNDNAHYNVNADHVAGAVAAALRAERLIFVSNVPGVLRDDALVPQLTPLQVDDLITNDIIYGGMIPKVETALNALRSGVRRTVITNLAGLKQGSGTVFQPDDIAGDNTN